MRAIERLQSALDGDAYAVAKCARMLDDRHPEMLTLLPSIFEGGQGAVLIGLTGNPGAGKSTLTNRIVSEYRRQGLRVAVIAVDPSSPFTGGAILGDRVRMQEHAGDGDVFIRSVATRGVLGGISHSTRDLIALFDYLGFERILVETVGVGQDEIDIAFTVDTNIVVCLPGTGDGVQMIKAGLLETADVFVLNKADHPESAQAVRQLERLVEWSKASEARGWQIPVCPTIATDNSGVTELVEQIDLHQTYLQTDTEAQERGAFRRRRWVEEIILARLQAEAVKRLEAVDFDASANPYIVAESIIRKLVKS